MPYSLTPMLFNATCYDLMNQVMARFKVAATSDKQAKSIVRKHIKDQPNLRSRFGEVKVNAVHEDGYTVTVLTKESVGGDLSDVL